MWASGHSRKMPDVSDEKRLEVGREECATAAWWLGWWKEVVSLLGCSFPQWVSSKVTTWW